VTLIEDTTTEGRSLIVAVLLVHTFLHL